MDTRPVYMVLAQLVDARQRCVAQNNMEWVEEHTTSIYDILDAYMPSGSGFDVRATIDLELSTVERLVLGTSFHHMDENGFYNGWTTHAVFITPSLLYGCKVRVTGEDRNEIKDHIAESFDAALRQPYQEK